MVFPMLISNTCYIDEFRSYLRNSFFFHYMIRMSKHVVLIFMRIVCYITRIFIKNNIF